MSNSGNPPQESAKVTKPILAPTEIKNTKGRPRKIVDPSYSEEEDENLQLTLSYRTIIATNTKRLREKLGLRQLDLANLMGTGQAQVASLEMARVSIGLHSLTRLATALKVEPPSLLLPFTETDAEEVDAPSEDTLTEADAEKVDAPSEGTLTEADAEKANAPSDRAIRAKKAQPPQSRVASMPEMLAGNLAVGVSLTAVKGIVAAAHKRLEDLERRHGSVPMTREMLTSLIVTVLNASQNLDSEG